ncbi:hypothetical protein ElyMa_004210700 [Elysia marginata]|uniref:Uncharacterized protein n=1 Tax=Elysia marginata TaxID=1093978 RepID=A0AAV4GRE6_9GAST|nr:hypothetical protein ElyMa_004210700 [Elysia marginata]
MCECVSAITQGYPLCRGFPVDPEGDEREHDQQTTRQVQIDQEVTRVTRQKTKDAIMMMTMMKKKKKKEMVMMMMMYDDDDENDD